MILIVSLTNCSTIENRSKPPPIEYFKENYESVYKDLVKTNSFSFIYKGEKYNFNLALTYLDQGPQEYYLGYKNGNLAYVIPAKEISLLKDIFESKIPLYAKTRSIIAKLNELNLAPVYSVAYKIKPKNSVPYDLTVDTLNFVVYGSIAMIGIPWIIGGYAEHLSKEKTQSKLNQVRVGMSYEEVNKIIPDRLDRKMIDHYNVEIFTSDEAHWYTNALLIFEDNVLVGIIRSVTTKPISDYYKKL